MLNKCSTCVLVDLISKVLPDFPTAELALGPLPTLIARTCFVFAHPIATTLIVFDTLSHNSMQ